jgi:hypothetical protein
VHRFLIFSLMGCTFSYPFGSAALADAPRLSFGKAEPMRGMNAMFERKEGWIRADGAHSVALNGHRRLWLFSDTWVVSVRDGTRFDATDN